MHGRSTVLNASRGVVWFLRTVAVATPLQLDKLDAEVKWRALISLVRGRRVCKSLVPGWARNDASVISANTSQSIALLVSTARLPRPRPCGMRFLSPRTQKTMYARRRVQYRGSPVHVAQLEQKNVST